MTLQENQEITSTFTRCKWTYDQEKTMIETVDQMQGDNNTYRSEYMWNIWQFKNVSWVLEGTEGSSKFKTLQMCQSHWDALHRRYKDAKVLQKEWGAHWNDESSMIELSAEQWNAMASMPEAAFTNKRLGWFRKGRFPLYHAFGAVVDRGVVKNDVQINTIDCVDRRETDDIDQLGRTSSEHLRSHSSDPSNQELQKANLESASAHASSTSPMADSSILSNKSDKKRKFSEEKSASNEDVQARSTSTVSGSISSASARKKPCKSTAELFIDSMESMQDRFLDKMNADLTASPSGSMKVPSDYVVMAVDLLQKMKNLDTRLLFKALDLFKDQPEYASMFLGLQKEDLQIKWLKYKLKSL